MESVGKCRPRWRPEFRQKVSPKAKWEPGQIGYRDPRTGKEGLLDVIRNTETQEYRDLQGNIISEGLLGSGAAAPQLPSAGLLSPATARLQMPASGLLAPVPSDSLAQETLI